MNEIKAFIPAAGLGERLRPITDHIPKPLLPVVGVPVIENVISRLRSLAVKGIGINVHYKREIMLKWGSSFDRDKIIQVFIEEEILGTGGALRNAGDFLSGCTFIVHNSDILSDIDLAELIDFHHSRRNLATLAVHDFERFNFVQIDDDGYLRGIANGNPTDSAVAYTGIAVYDPGFLEYLPPGKSSVVDAWLKAVAEGEKIGTLDVTGCYWNDIGRPDDYASAVFRELRQQGEVIYMSSDFDSCSGIEMIGNVVAEGGCSIEKNVVLRNCIILPGASVPSGARIENAIVGRDFRVELNEKEVFAFEYEGDMRLIGQGGSDRKYYRVNKGAESAILMKCMPDDMDFKRHIWLTELFRRNSIPVPEVLESDFKNRCAWFEDAGDISLYSWLKCSRNGKEIEDVYRKVLDAAILIHRLDAASVIDSGIWPRYFDYEHFRWETSYFMDRFIRGQMGIEPHDMEDIESDLHLIAKRADTFNKAVIHRDLQSQNVLVMRNGEIRIIDFQGARKGPPAYDIASLLWDPYYRMDDRIRESLLDYYTRMIAEKLNPDSFHEELLICRLQRHMQALGAYSYLSMVKGKNYFRKFISEGVRLLKGDIEPVMHVYPSLYGLIDRLYI